MMKINLDSGLIEGVRFLASPYFNQRPPNTDISLCVIHCISMPEGTFGGGDIEALFTGKLDIDAHPSYSELPDLKVAAHLLIKRDGLIAQFVPLHLRAWHAGNSIFQGRENCNDFSIGIELEGTDKLPYEDIQYQQLAQVIKLLMTAFPQLTRERIVGHADISPGRRSDPGEAFDWDYLDSYLQGSDQ